VAIEDNNPKIQKLRAQVLVQDEKRRQRALRKQKPKKRRVRKKLLFRERAKRVEEQLTRRYLASALFLKGKNVDGVYLTLKELGYRVTRRTCYTDLLWLQQDLLERAAARRFINQRATVGVVDGNTKETAP